jgi:hypothetical protein
MNNNNQIYTLLFKLIDKEEPLTKEESSLLSNELSKPENLKYIQDVFSIDKTIEETSKDLFQIKNGEIILPPFSKIVEEIQASEQTNKVLKHKGKQSILQTLSIQLIPFFKKPIFAYSLTIFITIIGLIFFLFMNPTKILFVKENKIKTDTLLIYKSKNDKMLDSSTKLITELTKKSEQIEKKIKNINKLDSFLKLITELTKKTLENEINIKKYYSKLNENIETLENQISINQRRPLMSNAPESSTGSIKREVYTNLKDALAYTKIVYSLDLSSQDLSKFPKEICQLHNLKKLNLSNCNMKDISENIFSKMINLEILDLSNNQLTILPNDISKLSNSLKVLYIKNNKFTPEFIKSLIRILPNTNIIGIGN